MKTETAVADATIEIPSRLHFAMLEQLLERPNPFGEELIVPRLATRIVADRIPPAIGQPFDGGIYAGITLHDGQAMALVLHDDEYDGQCTWKEAMAWAESIAQELPSRIDALVLYKNLKDRFKPEWYWTAEKHASNESYAWVQDFYDGGQLYDGKANRYRARAVRRVAI
jgi:hypothetical protein